MTTGHQMVHAEWGVVVVLDVRNNGEAVVRLENNTERTCLQSELGGMTREWLDKQTNVVIGPDTGSA